MITLKLTVTVHTRHVGGDIAYKNLQNLTDLFLGQCLPMFFQPEHWKKETFLYHPDEEAEAKGIDYLGMNLKLQRTCKSPYRAVLLAQAIQTVSLIFDDLYDEKFSFRIDSLS